MADIFSLDPDLEWLDHVQPVGLVVAPSLLKELGLVPARQTQLDSAEVAELLSEDAAAPALADPWAFASGILDWRPDLVAGAPGGPPLPEELVRRLPEYDTTLEPHWAVKMPGSAGGWQLLVRLERTGTDLDARGALDGWEATPHQRFERLLRETSIPAGVLISDQELRLVYAPRGETSGWLAFPLRPLATVSGRAMLGGLKLLLHGFRLFNDAEDRRLPALLRQSREAQAAVSTALAEQVLGALHELLRGLTAAEPVLVRDLAEHRSHHLYEGLLTVLMRLVFVLYAEDRDLLPSRTDTTARAFYDQGYSLRGLHAKLLDDAARFPDTMDERQGGWGRLLALFRLIHAGDRTGWITGRGGKLFDPDAFPFLEGRRDAAESARVAKVSDGCLLRLLDGLVMLKGERLSYRTLDVEQIGSVYETVMGFTVEQAAGPVLAIRAGKNNRTPVFVDLAALAKAKPEDRLKRLKDDAHRGSLTPKQQKAIKEAKGVDGLAAVLETIADERASPSRRVLPAGTPILQPTDERRRTGSHYTPRSLTEPIVRHALEPAFARLGPDATAEQVLELKVCDPAMGSGAFLVEACRALATRLVQAWARWPASRPVIPADEDEDLHARRLVAQRCLYGVDRNPMAVDLARLSLWLATLARDHEFTFLDHALKCGDSLVGLNREQVAALHWDTSKPPMALFGSLVEERIQSTLQGRAEIRNAPDNVTRAQQEIRFQRIEERLDHARLIGDAVIAAYFSAEKPKLRETARAEIEMEAMGSADKVWTKLKSLRAALRREPHSVYPLHWHLEFPEVFVRETPGFDAIIGNPPFAGKNTIAAGNPPGTIEWLQTIHAGAHGNADLVAHFFRRAFALLRPGGCFGLIATNTIGQGDTRQTGLAAILKAGGTITHATRRLKWPGEAAVVVSVVHVERPRPAGNGGGTPPLQEHRGWYRPRQLPHFDTVNALQAITFRLGDSLPDGVVERLAGEDQAAQRRRVAGLLDAGHGSCLLADPAAAAIVEGALKHFDGERYHLLAWIVMPNHVHVLIEPHAGWALGEIVQAWKSWTAKELNRLRGTAGSVWQKDYFDRMIRDERHLAATVAYIETNPVRAGLVEDPEAWRFSSVRERSRLADIGSERPRPAGIGGGTPPLLDGRPVSRISAYLVEGTRDDPPEPLATNAGKAFVGSYVLGMGFTFDDEAAAKGTASSLAEMERLIAKDPRNAERIFPYIGGEEVNNDPRHAHRRYVIDFGDMPLCREDGGGTPPLQTSFRPEETSFPPKGASASRRPSWFDMTPETRAKTLREGVVPQDYPGPVAEDWPDLLDVVRRLVKPQRDKLKGNTDAERRRKFWWKWGRVTPALQKALFGAKGAHVLSRVSPHHMVCSTSADMVFAESMVIFPGGHPQVFSTLQSRPHEVWTRVFASSMKDDLRYTPSDCFETFPFPPDFESNLDLEAAGQAYHDHRAALMVARNEGLTKTYNRFHDPRETGADILRLRELHDAMDQAVLRAYGWNDLAEQARPVFLDESTEDDHKYQGRTFWPAEFRDEVLARLLALNAQRAAEEKSLGLTAKGRNYKSDGDEDLEDA